MQENDRLLKADIEVPDLSKSIMAEVRKNKRNKRPFYISLAASGLAAAAALALVFGGKVAPQQSVNPSETQQGLSMRSVERVTMPTEDLEVAAEATEGSFVGNISDAPTEGVFQAAPTSDEVEKATISDEIAALVIHAEPSEIEFEGTALSMRDLASVQSEVDYKFSNNVTAVYSVSWEVLEQIAADYEDTFDIEKCYDADTIYYNAIVIFVTD